MREVTAKQIQAALTQVDIQPGDGLLVHAAIHYLGRPADGMETYYQALYRALEGTPEQGDPAEGEHILRHGTLAVPAFNFGFARGAAYHPQETPSVGMGVFAEYIRQRPDAQRTSHPMQSMAMVGRYASDLAGRDTVSAFDNGSAFERLLELDFKLLLLGADIQAVSLLHLSEQRSGVPYRYWKDFSGQVYTPHGWEERTYRMYARDLELDPHIELYPVQAVLEESKQWRSVQLNYGQVASCRLRDFVQAVDEFLAGDPWSLVTNRPAGA